MPWTAAWGWTSLLLLALWGPSPPHKPLFPSDDKLFHLAGFLVLGCAWRWALGSAPAAAAVGVALAVISEAGQAVVPWPRTPELADGVADVVGLGFGVAAAGWLLRVWPTKKRTASGG